MDMIAWREGGQKAKKKKKSISFSSMCWWWDALLSEWCWGIITMGWTVLQGSSLLFYPSISLGFLYYGSVNLSKIPTYLIKKTSVWKQKKMESSPSKTILTHCLHLVGNLGGLKSIKNCGWGHVIWSKLKSTSAHFIKEACSRRWSRHNLASV